jgi:putative RNA 2'-phosphotransferase
VFVLGPFWAPRYSGFLAMRLEDLSKLLSFALRHEPQKVGLTLDPGGWVELDVLVTTLAASDPSLTRERVLEVVRTSDKQRFALSDDGKRIRANQGHSRAVDLGYAPEPPPSTLFHGTIEGALASIREQGLSRRRRQHVHLSRSAAAAAAVGSRRGSPVVLEIRAAEMAAAGHVFLRAPNDVWLTDSVPPAFIRFPD